MSFHEVVVETVKRHSKSNSMHSIVDVSVDNPDTTTGQLVTNIQDKSMNLSQTGFLVPNPWDIAMKTATKKRALELVPTSGID